MIRPRVPVRFVAWMKGAQKKLPLAQSLVTSTTSGGSAAVASHDDDAARGPASASAAALSTAAARRRGRDPGIVGASLSRTGCGKKPWNDEGPLSGPS